MQWLPYLVLFSGVCFVGAYGIEKRKPWAWYSGWVVAFFMAGAVTYCAIGILSNAKSAREYILGILFFGGGGFVWISWAVWWATHREEFLRAQEHTP